MRVVLQLALATPFVASVAATAQAPEATAILAAARQALGGERNLAAVKTFVATGRTRQVRGNSLVPIEFEISCELPDKYVRRDEIPAQESGPTASGFTGDLLIQVPPPPELPAPPTSPAGAPGGAAAPASTPRGTPAGAAGPTGTPGVRSDPRAQRVASLKQDFAKLALGMFATSFGSYPLTFTVAGKAEAPQGTADILDVKGPAQFALRYFIHSDTHLPVMVSWTTPATNVVMKMPGQPAPENVPPGSVVVEAPAPPGPDASREEQTKYARDLQDLRKKALAAAKPVENRIYYADYRDAGTNVKFPFRLRRAIAGETVEETNFDEFRINVRIDPRKFEAAPPPRR